MGLGRRYRSSGVHSQADSRLFAVSLSRLRAQRTLLLCVSAPLRLCVKQFPGFNSLWASALNPCTGEGGRPRLYLHYWMTSPVQRSRLFQNGHSGQASPSG